MFYKISVLAQKAYCTGVPRPVCVVYKIRTAYVLCQQTLISDTESYIVDAAVFLQKLFLQKHDSIHNLRLCIADLCLLT